MTECDVLAKRSVRKKRVLSFTLEKKIFLVVLALPLLALLAIISNPLPPRAKIANSFFLPSISTTTNTDNTSSTAIRQQRNPSKEPIRSWGCHRKEAPLIYVHLGKSGGGSVRARFAAAALGYGRGKKWAKPNKDNHYYPMPNNSKGKFCTSQNNNYHVTNSILYKKTFEGNFNCNATTPIGMAVACPGKKRGCLKCSVHAKHCHTVYAGHNAMGSEINWLPPKILQQWWSENWEHPNSTHASGIKEALISLNPSDRGWCFGQAKRPADKEDHNQLYDKCSLPLASLMDGQFHQYWQQIHTRTDREMPFSVAKNDFSPIYASLPVHRVTVLRDPYSWLVSKFFWHSLEKFSECDDIKKASRPGGWAHYHILRAYILKLCGVDCSIRYENGLTSLDELEAQAESNLRQSFSVVGILNETDIFYEMVSKRISYVDMALNPHVIGEKHTSSSKAKKKEIDRCSKIYRNKDFQERFKKELPELATIERLYNVAVEVNRFQQEELKQCSVHQ